MVKLPRKSRGFTDNRLVPALPLLLANIPECAVTDQPLLLFVPQAVSEGFQAGEQSDGFDALKERFRFMTFLDELAKARPSLPNGTANTNYIPCSQADFDASYSERPLMAASSTARSLSTMRGCIVLTERTGDVLARVRAGKYDSFISDSTH